MDQQETLCPACGTAAPGARFCPECGTDIHDAIEDETRVMNGAAYARMRQALRPKPVPPLQSESRDLARGTGPSIIALLALLLAVAGVAVGVVGILKAQSTQSQDRKLRTSLTALGSRLTGELSTAQAAISNLKANSQAGAVSALQDQMTKLTVCIPELEQQIEGLNVNTSNQNGWLTSASLANPTIISSNCIKVLDGP